MLSPQPSERRRGYSVGYVLLAIIALVSAVLIALRPTPRTTPLELWSFARNHTDTYAQFVPAWNGAHPDSAVTLRLFDGNALERRLLSSFRSGTPSGDLLEVQDQIACNVFAGPVSDVGFLDLTDRLREEGLDKILNPPSLSMWTTRGRTFGLPHDVHPVLLAYRSDLAEAAGIDVSQVETWEDFARVFAPLMAEKGPDGRPVRYLLNLWPTNAPWMYTLLLQAGGGAFLEDGTLAIDRPANVRALSALATWCAGPSRIAIDAPEFTFTGNKLRVDGVVVASLMPDWLTGIWRRDMPELGGKLKLMPLPAWERGGRRTSVMGGTMLGIARTSKNREQAWAFAKHLYTSGELWDKVHAETGIIPPVRTLWERPVFHQPSPYFSNQAPAELYIAQAPQVPLRVASPFLNTATLRMNQVFIELARLAEERGIADPAALEADATRLLREAQADLERRVARNVFLKR